MINPSSGDTLMEMLETRFLFNSTTIDWSSVNQSITGFGASSAWTTQSVTASQQQLLFSPTNGAGISLLRSRINEDATTLAPNTPQAAGSYEVQTMQKAAAMGVTIWSTPWSPPAAWKSNGSVDNGGSLLTADYQNYANYLAAYVVSMKNQGIPIYGISLQNEPDENVSYDSCNWTAAQFAAFLPDVVTAFSNYGVSGTKIIFPEESGWHWELASTVMNTPSLNADISVYAGHDYDGGSFVVSGTAGKQVWMSEVYDPNSATGVSAALWVAQNIYSMIVTSDANAYDYWWIQNGSASGNGQLLSSNWQQQPLFWGLANYSKFIRPGWNNISQTNDGGITASAYRNTTTGDFATVLINSTSSPINETINLDGAYAPVLTPWVTSATLALQQQTPVTTTGNGGTFNYIIPAQSVVTLTGNATASPVTSPPAGLTVTPAGTNGMTLTWTTNIAGSTGYTVQRSSDGTNWSTLSSVVPSNTYAYNDLSLAANTLYYYRVIANNGSVYSNTSYAMTLPNPVTALTANYSASSLNVALNWTASTSTGTDYQVERSTDGGNTWTTLTSAVPNGTSTYTDTAAPEAASLEYQVLAINGANSSAAATASATTTVVRAPSGLNAVAGSVSGSVVLNWTNNSNEPAFTYIERSSIGGSTWTVVAHVGGGVSSYTDPAPGAGTFVYRVRAYYNSIYSAYSSIATFEINIFTINGAAGNNSFYLKDSGSTLDIWLNSSTPGSGTPTQTQSLGFTSLVINGGSGSNTATLDYSGGDPTGGSATFNGSAGSNTLVIQGEAGGVASTLGSSAVSIGNDAINYSSLQFLNLDLGSGSSTLTANSPGTTPLLTLTIDSGATLAMGTSSSLAINTIVTDSGTLNLSGENESIDQLSGGGTVTSTGNTLSIGANNGTSSFAGVLSGSLSLDKTGTGGFTNIGPSKYTGNTTVDLGFLTFAPTVGSDSLGSSSSSIFIAPANNDNGTLNIGPNVSFTAGGTYGGLFLACNSDSNNGGGIGTINQTGGAINVVSGVTYLGGANTIGNGANATWNISGGIANLNTGVTMSLNNNSISSINISGTARLNLLNNSSITLGQYYSRPATITQTGGAVSFFSDGGTTIGGTGSLDLDNGGGAYLYNLAGGTLIVPSISAASTAGSATIDLGGGLLAAAVANNNFIATTITSKVRAGGAFINPNGHAITIAAPLIHDSMLGGTADGGLSLNGSGALTLSATCTYTGVTNVTAGTLTVSGVGSISKSTGLSVSNAATFGYQPSTLGTLFLASGSTLTLASNSTIGLALGDKISVSGAATISPTVNLAFTGSPPSGTSTIYSVLGAGSGLGSGTSYQVSGIPAGFVTSVQSTGTLLQVKTVVSTATNLASNVSSASYGQLITFTATVSPTSGGSETGTVQFQIDGLNAGAAVTLSNGVANYSSSALSAGSHSILAIYSGDANYNGSTSATLGQSVIAMTSPLQLIGSAYLEVDPSVSGQLDVWYSLTNIGSPAATYPLSDISSIADAGTAGNDTLTANFSYGNPLASVIAGISFNTTGISGGSDSLIVAGDSSGNSFNATANQLLISGGNGASAYSNISITSVNVASRTILAGSGLDSIALSGGITLRYVAPQIGTYPIATVSSLSIATGSTLLFDSPFSTRALLELATVTSWSGTLDLQSNDLLAQGGPVAFNTTDSLVATGFGGGGWNGNGITSSTAANDSRHLTALGVIQNDQNGSPIYTASNPFDGVSANPTDVLVRYCYYGDANIDGKVDGSDYSLTDNGYLSTLTGWLNGDFNHDNVVNGSDYTLLDNAYDSQAGAQDSQLEPGRAPAASPVSHEQPWIDHSKKTLWSAGPPLAVSILG